MSPNKIYYSALNELAIPDRQQDVDLNAPVYTGTQILQLSVFPRSSQKRPLTVTIRPDGLVIKAKDDLPLTVYRHYDSDGSEWLEPVFVAAIGEIAIERCESPDDDKWRFAPGAHAPDINDPDAFAELIRVIADATIAKMEKAGP